VLLEAVGLAGLNTTAGIDTLGAPFGADVVGDGLRVHGEVGGDAVITDAGVSEGVWVAVVRFSGFRSDSGLL